MMPRRVLLPHPEGPTMASVTWPGGRPGSMSSRTSRPVVAVGDGFVAECDTGGCAGSRGMRPCPSGGTGPGSSQGAEEATCR